MRKRLRRQASAEYSVRISVDSPALVQTGPEAVTLIVSRPDQPFSIPTSVWPAWGSYTGYTLPRITTICHLNSTAVPLWLLIKPFSQTVAIHCQWPFTNQHKPNQSWVATCQWNLNNCQPLWCGATTRASSAVIARVSTVQTTNSGPSWSFDSQTQPMATTAPLFFKLGIAGGFGW